MGLLLAQGLGGCERREEAEVPAASASAQAVAAPTWRVGQRYRYAVEIESGVTSGKDDVEASSLALKATMDVVPLTARDGEVELSYRFSEVKLGTRGDGARELERTLSEPVVVTLQKGQVSNTRFSRGLSPVAVSLHRTLASALQFSPAPGGQRRWTAVERDATGQYQVEYVAETSSLIHRRKLAFEKTITAGKASLSTLAQLKPKIVESTGEVQLKDGVTVDVRLDDRIQTPLLQESKLTVHNRVRLTLHSGEPSPAVGVKRDALLEHTVSVSPERPLAGKLDGLFDDVRIGTETYESVLAELELQAKHGGLSDLWGAKNDELASPEEREARQLRVQQRVGAFSTLVAILRQQPEAVTKLKASVLDGSPAMGILLSALSSAATDACQRALAELMQNPALDRKHRVDAATSFILLRTPTPESVKTLQGLIDDPLLGQHAVFGLGIASRYLREAGQVERSKPLAELLVRKLTQARTKKGTIALLRGIANSAYEQAIPALEPHLTAEDPTIRAAAVEAVRLMRSPESEAVLAERLTKDSDIRVRSAALRSVHQREPSDVLVAAISRVAREDADIAPRQLATTKLADWLPKRPDLRPTLVTIAKNDPRPQIREIAAGALEKH